MNTNQTQPEAVNESKTYPLTAETRQKLYEVAKSLMAIWDDLPYVDEDGELSKDDYDNFYYRGGLLQLTVKGGYTQGQVSIDWNRVIADIYAGYKLLGPSYSEVCETIEAEIEAEKEKRYQTPNNSQQIEI